MTLEQYKNKKQEMINQAKALLSENKIDEARAKREEIEAFETNFENMTKELANLNAMSENNKVVNITDHSKKIEGATVMDATQDNIKDAKKDDIYVNAWAKDMMGIKMTTEESEIFKAVNEAFTHTTENTGVLVPETVATGIWKEIGNQYPLWEDVFKTYIKGNVSILKSESSTEAKWYDEATPIEDGKETFGKATLSGCELSRDITISWKLKEMAIKDFIPFIQSQLAEKMGAALGYGVAIGKGKAGDGDTHKDEPRGIITALEAEVGTPQIITYTEEDGLTYKSCTEAMGLVKGAYKKGAFIYANGVTIWNVLANICDAVGRPYFVADAMNDGVGRIFGHIVKEDDSIPNGQILLANPKKGYHANINKQILLDSDNRKKARETDYIAYGIIDGDVRTTKAFALIKKETVLKSTTKNTK